jgi:hypothetical protein
MCTFRVCSILIPASMVGFCAPEAHAVYTGLTIEMHSTVSIDDSSYNVWRVYANFSDPGDRLVAGFGATDFGDITLQARNGDDTDFGNPFFNTGGNSTAPWQEEIDLNPAVQWDTYVTIGTPLADLAPGNDQTSLTPGFVPISGNNWVQNDVAWYAVPTHDHDNNAGTPEVPPAQTLAGWQGDGDAANRVMMLQLTVASGDNVRGTVNLAWFAPIQFGGFVVNQPIQTFNSFTVPGPSALGLLGAAALIRRRRRGDRRRLMTDRL